MNKVKKLAALVLAVVICIAFAGCNYAQTIEIKADGKAKVTAKITISEKELEKLNALGALSESGADSANTSLGINSFDDFKKESDKKGLTKTIDGVKYYANESTQDINSLDELVTLGAGEFTTTEFWAYGSETSETQQYMDTFKALDISFTAEMVVKMPYKIIKTNCEKVDDYTVKYDEKATLVYAITEKSTAAWTKEADTEKAVMDLGKAFYTPKKVTGVKVAYKNAKSLKVIWNYPSSYVTGYKIEKKVGNGKWQLVKTLSTMSTTFDTSYTDKKISANKKYSYRVKAYYSDINFTVEGPYSAVKTIKTADLKTKPIVKANAGSSSVTLKLKKATKNVVGYEIKYADNAKFKKAKTIKVKKMPATIKNLKSGSKYYFKVRKYCQGTVTKVYSPFSKSVSVTVK